MALRICRSYAAIAWVVGIPAFAYADNCGGLLDCYGTKVAAATVGVTIAVALVLWWFVLPEILAAAGAYVEVSEAGLLAQVATESATLNPIIAGAGGADAVLDELVGRELTRQALEGAGRVIAGAGSKRAIDDIAYILDEWGGGAEDWVKLATEKRMLSNGLSVEIHYYLNLLTRAVVNLKTKVVN